MLSKNNIKYNCGQSISFLSPPLTLQLCDSCPWILPLNDKSILHQNHQFLGIYHSLKVYTVTSTNVFIKCLTSHFPTYSDVMHLTRAPYQHVLTTVRCYSMLHCALYAIIIVISLYTLFGIYPHIHLVTVHNNIKSNIIWLRIWWSQIVWIL